MGSIQISISGVSIPKIVVSRPSDPPPIPRYILRIVIPLQKSIFYSSVSVTFTTCKRTFLGITCWQLLLEESEPRGWRRKKSKIVAQSQSQSQRSIRTKANEKNGTSTGYKPEYSPLNTQYRERNFLHRFTERAVELSALPVQVACNSLIIFFLKDKELPGFRAPKSLRTASTKAFTLIVLYQHTPLAPREKRIAKRNSTISLIPFFLFFIFHFSILHFRSHFETSLSPGF